VNVRLMYVRLVYVRVVYIPLVYLRLVYVRLMFGVCPFGVCPCGVCPFGVRTSGVCPFDVRPCGVCPFGVYVRLMLSPSGVCPFGACPFEVNIQYLSPEDSQSIFSFNVSFNSKIVSFFQQFFFFALGSIRCFRPFFCLDDLPTVLTIFSLDYGKSIHCVNLVFNWKILPLFQKFLALGL